MNMASAMLVLLHIEITMFVSRYIEKSYAFAHLYGSTLCHDFLVAQLASTKIVDLCEQAHCRQSGNHCSMNDEHGDCDACAFTHRDYLVLHIETTLFSHGTDMQVPYLHMQCVC